MQWAEELVVGGTEKSNNTLKRWEHYFQSLVNLVRKKDDELQVDGSFWEGPAEIQIYGVVEKVSSTNYSVLWWKFRLKEFEIFLKSNVKNFLQSRRQRFAAVLGAAAPETKQKPFF